MDLSVVLAPTVAIATAVTAAVTTWNGTSPLRERKFRERTAGLVEVAAHLNGLGAMAGKDASASSTKSHALLLLQIDREIRANAAEYVASTSRLTRGGSTVSVLTYLVYAAFLLWIALSSALDPSDSSNSQGAAVAKAVFFGVGLVVSGMCVREGHRRITTWRIRRQIGQVDSISREGASEIWTAIRNLLAVIFSNAKSSGFSPEEPAEDDQACGGASGGIADGDLRRVVLEEYVPATEPRAAIS